jgi:hypothetical protein
MSFQALDDGEVYFRLVVTDPPTTNDFLSHEARGRIPRGPHTEHQQLLWTYLSFFETEQQARIHANKFVRLGRFIAAVRISNAMRVDVLLERSSSGHRSIRGDAEEFLRAVIAVVPV